ncbi:GlxA family transcriptional regulator [Streptomyces qinzhouensis]|uniref:Helix-turn-helix domain-containing protein n=1 Tax=Streptomyces qinzhouensis TaxID=2599401 RepID=A0A5B8JIB7_9ACTN|nr:helix-turn-helix domain-containing protein [Streptomyces qinzhouensis]QDY80114.1 helix-turn-helix domain-containing protein [Streptomyces qinzhouensis]
MNVVALLVLDGVPGDQLTTPGQLFGAVAGVSCQRAGYELRICSGAGSVTTAGPGAFRVATLWGTDGLDGAGTVIVPGYGGFRDEPPAGVLEAVRAAAGRGSRIGAVGTGTFALAAAGLLDGRRATTDWRHIEELARRYPGVGAGPGDAPVADGPYLTSAGVLGGKDLCLRIIGEDHGEAMAHEVDRRLFLRLPAPPAGAAGRVPPAPAPGPGGAYDPGPGGTDGLGPTLRWLEEELHRPLTLDSIAARAGTSVRTLTRRFRAVTGLSPLQYLLRARMRRAQWLLERGDASVERIAAETGLGTPANLRHHFQRVNGTTPGVYRAAFRSMVGMFTPDHEIAAADGPV